MRLLPFVLLLLVNSLVSKEIITPENAQELFPIEIIEHDPWDLVMDTAWSPDGKRLAVSSGNYLRVYDSQNLSLLNKLEIGSLSHSVEYSSNGKWLAVGSRDGFIRIWEVSKIENSNPDSPAPVIKIEAHKKGVNSIVFDSSGERIASSGNDAVAKVWDIETGENQANLIGGTLTIPAVEFIIDEKSLALANGNVIRLREIGNERITGTFLSDNPLFCLDISPDGSLLAAGDIENKIMLWGPDSAFRTGVEEFPEADILAGHEGKSNSYKSLVWDVEFNPSGNLLASAGGDGTIKVWDVSQKELLVSLEGHSHGVTSIAFDPEGQILASGGLDGTIKLWGIR